MNSSIFEGFSSDCRDVNSFNDSRLQCQFVQNVTDCTDDDGFINYTKLIYCTIGSAYKGIIVLFLWLLVLFTGLGITADDFLCPALLVISRTLRLSHNIAGVTFLAFGNGAPDIFSSIAGIRQANPELVIGELYGAGIFVTTVVAGTIFILSDFKPMARPLCRDIVFYIITTFFVWLTFMGESIKMSHSIAFISIYLFYIVTVVGAGIIYTKFLKKDTEPSDEPPEETSGRISKLVFSRTYFGQASRARRPSVKDVGDNYEGVVLRRIEFRDVGATSPQRRRTLSSNKYPYHHHHKNVIFSITKQEQENNENATIEGRMDRSNTISDSSFPSRSPVIGNKKKNLLLHQISKISLSSVWSSTTSVTEVMTQWREFLIQICPIDLGSFRKDPWYSKIFTVFKAPIYFILTVTIPVVDEENEKHNWLSNDGNLIVEWTVLGVSLFLAVLVFFTSINEKPPVYHSAFAYFGFVISVSWIYALANEVVDLLKAVGIIFNLSHFLLGLTVLAWGNSVGDFISNLSMARNGFPRMGISACFGGPVLNMLLGIGVPYTVLLSSGVTVDLHYSKMVTLLYSTITLSLGSTLLIMILTRFESKKLHGLYLICIFLVFLTLACLIEWSVL